MSGRRRTVLVVEDDAEIRDVLVELFNLSGFRTLAAGHGLEALQLLEAGERPGAILLDLMMPVMDAWQFRERQRQGDGIRDIPVVVLTAYPDPQGRARSIGAVEYLSKPLDADAIVAAVERAYLEQGSTAAPTQA